MLELNWKGTMEVPLPDGTTRKFIQVSPAIAFLGGSSG